MSAREFPERPLVGVGAVVFDAQGRLLLVKRGTEPMKGRWSLPGGLVELGETLEAAVEREVAEETGVEVTAGERIEVVERIYKEAHGMEMRVRYHYIIVDYLCAEIGGEIGAYSDADEAAWVTRDAWELTGANPYNLEKEARLIIEKGWRMATDGNVSA